MSSRILAGSYFFSCLGAAVLTLAFASYAYAASGTRSCFSSCTCKDVAKNGACVAINGGGACNASEPCAQCGGTANETACNST